MSSKKNMIPKKLVGVLFLISLVSPCLALGNDFTITPSKPVVGDLVTMKGSALPNSSVNAQVSFEKMLPVQNGGFQLILRQIVIPAGNNAFTVKTSNVDRMFVGLKQGIWTTVNAGNVNGVSTISQSNISPGKYDVRIGGDSKVSTVKLVVTASKTFNTDSKGNYVFVYNSAGMPSGKYSIKIGNVIKSFNLN
jgi:hypothetical protein